MKNKKVIVHGSPDSLYEFLDSPFNKSYDILALITDKPRKFNKNKVRNPAVENLEIISAADLPKFVYRLADGVVLTDNSTKAQMIQKFARRVEPKKIILWNNKGIPEFFNATDPNGVNVIFMEGLQFHIKNPDDEKFFNTIRNYFYSNKQFYAIPPAQYPQVVAQIYQQIIGRPLDWNNLQTWTERIQWLKLYDSTPLKAQWADKVLAKQLATEKIGTEYIIPTLGVWNNFDEIDFTALPSQFVLKCNHTSGAYMVVRDKNNFDIEKAREKFNAWMSINYGSSQFNFELYYDWIPRKIIAEKYMQDEKFLYPVDYKFFCFDGKVKYLYYVSDRSNDKETFDEKIRVDYFDMNWNHMDYGQVDHPRSEHPEKIQKPKNFELMKKLAEKLSQDFIHVRVDFYEIKGKVYFGEMTFLTNGGTIGFTKDEANYHWGSLIHIPAITPPPPIKNTNFNIEKSCRVGRIFFVLV